MVRFLMARVHRGRYRQLVAGAGLPSEAVPDVALIACPVCGHEYFADLEPGAEPWDEEALEWLALELLAGECPDHAHRFVVA